MSRIGRMPVTIPAGVEVSVAEPNVVTVKGPKGTLTQTMRPEMIIKVEGNVIHVGRPSFGLERQRMVAKMVVGHDRVTFVFLDTEYRHFCDLLRLRFQI